jgi:hypothetical protein
MHPRIRISIRTKISWIRNTGLKQRCGSGWIGIFLAGVLIQIGFQILPVRIRIRNHINFNQMES